MFRFKKLLGVIYLLNFLHNTLPSLTEEIVHNHTLHAQRITDAVELKALMTTILSQNSSYQLCPAPRLPQSEDDCKKPACEKDEDCTSKNLSCCFNGCVFSCVERIAPPPVFDYEDDSEPSQLEMEGMVINYEGENEDYNEQTLNREGAVIDYEDEHEQSHLDHNGTADYEDENEQSHYLDHEEAGIDWDNENDQLHLDHEETAVDWENENEQPLIEHEETEDYLTDYPASYEMSPVETGEYLADDPAPHESLAETGDYLADDPASHENLPIETMGYVADDPASHKSSPVETAVRLPGGCVLSEEQFGDMNDFMKRPFVEHCSCIEGSVECKLLH